jgi:hypothetical protein
MSCQDRQPGRAQPLAAPGRDHQIPAVGGQPAGECFPDSRGRSGDKPIHGNLPTSAATSHSWCGQVDPADVSRWARLMASGSTVGQLCSSARFAPSIGSELAAGSGPPADSALTAATAGLTTAHSPHLGQASAICTATPRIPPSGKLSISPACTAARALTLIARSAAQIPSAQCRAALARRTWQTRHLQRLLPAALRCSSPLRRPHGCAGPRETVWSLFPGPAASSVR